MKAAVVAALTLAFALPASAVDTNIFTQLSEPLGLVDEVSYEQTATEVSTVTAPWRSGSYRFTHWTVGSSVQSGTRRDDVLGKALNPVTFTILEDSFAVAHYLDGELDDDADGVPDWYEVHYYASTNQAADSDTDGDGFDLATERRRDFHPRIADRIADGGISRRRSSLQPLILDPIYRRYSERSEPAGLVDLTRFVSNGVAVTTPSLYGKKEGYRFAYWTRDGVRQEDASGRGVSQVSTVVTAETALVAHYIEAGLDQDEDGIADWYEWHFFGSVTNAADTDGDRDGFDLQTEYRRDFNPAMVDTIADGGLSRRRSMTAPFFGSEYIPYVINSSPAGLVDDYGFVTSGVSVVTASLHGEKSGYLFGYWTVNGERQADDSGTALAQVQVVIRTNTTITAHYFDKAEDLDGDTIADWYEWFRYGSTNQAPSSDTDGDGFDLQVEYQRHFNPTQIDILKDGGISRRRSSRILMNMQMYPRMRRALLDGQLADVFSRWPPVVGGIDFGVNTAPGLGDWDADGDLDLFVGDAESGLTVFENIGTRHTLNLTDRSSAFDTATAGIVNPTPALGDWSGDGKADLAIGGDIGFVRLGRSSGDFGSAFSIDHDFTISGATSTVPTLAEMSGDDRLDLLVLLADGTVNVYANSGSLTTPFSEPAHTVNLLPESVPGGTGLGVADVNRDGLADVLVSDHEGRIWEFRGRENGSFSLWSKMWSGAGYGFADRLTLALGDLDGDSDTDAICGFAQGGLVYIRDPRLSVPYGLVARGGIDSIRLDWSPNREHRLDGYFVYRATDEAGPFARVRPVPTAASQFVDTNVTVGVQYYYYVTAVNDRRVPGAAQPDYVESPPSDIATALAGAVRLWMPDYRGAPGSNAVLKINVDNATGIAGEGLRLVVDYDPAVMVPVSQVDAGAASVLPSALSAGLVLSNNAATANGELVIAATGGGPLRGGGLLFNVVFRVDVTAANGTTSSNRLIEAVLKDSVGQALTVDASDTATLTVEDTFLRGDVTGNGVLNLQDVVLMLKLAAGWRDPFEWELLSGDLNGDGRIDGVDAHLLLREWRASITSAKPAEQRAHLSASGDYLVSMGANEGVAGAELLIPVLISNAGGLASLAVQVNYDPAVLEVLGIETANTLAEAFEVQAVIRDGVVRLALAREDGLLSGSGTLVYLRVRVNSGAAPGTGSDLVVARCELGGELGLDLAWDALVSQENGVLYVVLSDAVDSDGDGLTDYQEQLYDGSHAYDPGGSDPDISNPDSDGDGIPDGWEVDNGLDPLRDDAGEDADGDGETNRREHIAGTDPRDGSQQFRIETLSSDGTNVVIRWDSVTGRLYSVFSSTNLLSGWQRQDSGLPGDNLPKDYTNSLDEDIMYLRVGVELVE